jgi:hypothetical protein
MKRFLAFLLALIVVSWQPASAQVATTGNKLGFTEVGMTVAIANSATYKIYVDGAATGAATTGLTCAAGSPATNADCSVNLPALTVGTHTVTLTQVISAAESAKPTPFSFSFVVVVTPTGLQIVNLQDLLSGIGFSLS